MIHLPCAHHDRSVLKVPNPTDRVTGPIGICLDVAKVEATFANRRRWLLAISFDPRSSPVLGACANLLPGILSGDVSD